jgi:electron transport complex protein RnfG
MTNTKEFFKPVLTLVTIAAVMTGLMVVTNLLTFERIELLANTAMQEAKARILPEASNFTLQQTHFNGSDINYFVSDQGDYVFVTRTNGYGGEMVVLTAVNAAGVVTGMEVLSHTETPGLGERAFTYYQLHQFKIPVPDRGFFTGTTGDVDGYPVDSVTGVTITVDAFTNAVNEALEIYRHVQGVD